MTIIAWDMIPSPIQNQKLSGSYRRARYQLAQNDAVCGGQFGIGDQPQAVSRPVTTRDTPSAIADILMDGRIQVYA